MEPFDPSMFPHTVTVGGLAEGVDAEGGVVERPQAGATLPCRVSLRSSMIGYGGGQETGVTVAQVAFPHDPGFVKGDRMAYVGRDIRAVAPARPRDGDGVLFVVDGHLID